MFHLRGVITIPRGGFGGREVQLTLFKLAVKLPPERSREFGSHRATSDNNSFNPPPPTRTPPKSGSDSGTSTSSTMEKDGKSNLGERKNENSRDQGKEAKQDSSEKRNIGSRRR
ncbi:hypothetical protein JGI6_00489 [Candidatus Kryptonium thompsonii]|nr:hypothetical protein JGI6_00489 [Candidatus Kryptonium thompsoni]